MKVRVLLVDDQALIGEAVRRVLASTEDTEFHYCQDPLTAVQVALAFRPTVILQDLVMPGVDGLALLARYRATPGLAEVPALMLSTKEDPAVKCAAFAAGADDYLVKLPDAVELLARIRYHSRSYLALQERDEAFQALRESQRQLLEANQALHRLSTADGLTGLANRRHFDATLEAEWQRALRERRALSLLLIDIDHFKAYNDHFGHVAGDEALRRVAACLQDAAHRSTDTAARYGGEEFALILPGTSAGGARLVAEKLRMSIEAMGIAHVKPPDGSRVTASIGIATLVPDAVHQPVALIELADQGLYLAKGAGRNRCGVAPQSPDPTENPISASAPRAR